MPTYINIENNLTEAISITTTVNPSLSSSDWGVDSTNPPVGQTTRIMWMNRDEGIHDKDTWIFTTGLTFGGVDIQLQESLTGTLLGSTLKIQIVAGNQSTGWQSNNTSLAFTGTDGNAFRINGTFFLDGIYDDVTYSISRSILPQINHVVVLMMENRSLDNLLGWLYADKDNQPPYNIPTQTTPSYNGLVGNTYGNHLTPDSPVVYASEGTSSNSTVVPAPDPGEAFTQMTAQIFGESATANMSGFLANYATLDTTDPDQIMQSYSPAQVPVLSQIARAFAVSDAWYASVPCQTWPNRGFVHTGSSDGQIDNDYVEPYDINTIFNLLEDQGMSWMVYNDTSIVPSLVHIMFPKLWLMEDHFADMTPFYVLCQQPATAPASQKLPLYTFIEPNFLDPDESYHPPHDITPGETFLEKVYSAIQASPYRDEILFVIVFDEHGGCYDHVPPPPPPLDAVPPVPGSVSRDGSFNFSRYGVRVPAIVVSSYVQAGTVFRSQGETPYDHTSILATLRDWLGINPATFLASLPSPRITAAPTLEPVLTQAAARDWPLISAPAIEAKAVDLNERPNDLVMSIVIGEASRRAGKYIGRSSAAALRQEIQTVQQARTYFAARPAKTR